MTPSDALRLLPWTTPEGKPCYLSTDSDQSRLSLLADAKAGERAVRFALTRASESLEDALRITVSRGERIEGRGGTDDGL
jgi:hypothetical protein